MDWIGHLVELWNDYGSNPVLWIFLIPFILWWFNFLKKQFDESGLRKYVTKGLSSFKNILNKDKTEQQYIVTPSPKSGSPINFWFEILIWPLFMTPLIILISVNTIATGANWWITFSWLVTIFVGIFGIPVYVTTIFMWLQARSEIKRALPKLRQHIVSSGNNTITYHDLFMCLSDDFRMGLDPRILTIVYPDYCIDALSFFNELISLKLVKPDRKIKYDKLAHRYYLTRTGSTLAKQSTIPIRGVN